jgi:uncharacterized protein YqjF (DUF2071 family)
MASQPAPKNIPDHANPATERWRLLMEWYDLAFFHWPIAPRSLARLLPEALELDLWEGHAWLGIVPFAMRGIRARRCPAFPGLSRSLELNVRTYVIHQGRPGVWFFSLDAAHPVLVHGARATFALPYYQARMQREQSDGWNLFSSERTHRGVAAARFAARYRAVGDAAIPVNGSLEHWLTERYCFYTVDRRNRLRRCDVAHRPWQLWPGEYELIENDLVQGLSLPALPKAAHCHVAAPQFVQATGLIHQAVAPPMGGMSGGGKLR